MPEFLRDPVWQSLGVLLSCICGTIPIVLSVVFFVLERRKKSLSYTLLAESNLVTVGDEIKNRLQISFNNVAIQDAFLILLQVKNDGNIAITSSDFETPIVFSFGTEALILEAEVLDKQPQTIQPKITANPNKLEIAPILLNPKDVFSIKVLVAKYEKLTAHTRIVGVTEIKQNASEATDFPVLGMIVFPSITGMACSLYINIAFGIFMLQNPSENLLYEGLVFGSYFNNFFVASGIIVLLSAYSIYWFYKEEKQKNKGKH